MKDLDIGAALREELGNIAPEIDMNSVDPYLDLREALDIDSMTFSNFITAIHHRFGINIPGDRLSKAHEPSMQPLATSKQKLG